MPANWSITLDWEKLDSGTPEEQACFAALGIQAYGAWLTEGRDALANRLRNAPLLSAYHFAEWLAWNWWRLRWEPRSPASEWNYSHHLPTIGGGYIWPNITIFSDGQRTALIAKPTAESAQTPFRYIGDVAAVIQASEFETELDNFMQQIVERLDSAKLSGSNFAKIWNDVSTERSTPELAKRRKLEALLGQEPDESNPDLLAQLVADAEQLGLAAIEEVAADHLGDAVLTASQLRDIADDRGFDASPRDAVHLRPGAGLPASGKVAAWRLGAEAARTLREQEKLDNKPIADNQLARLCGTQSAVLKDRRGATGISFALDQTPKNGRIVLRSKWDTGRRFELARLLGDRIATPNAARLLPATRAHTYRQKMQRSFAAEFLSPFEAVDEMLAGDFSLENQLEVAKHFEVSELAIRTLLVNHGRLEREDFNADFEAAA